VNDDLLGRAPGVKLWGKKNMARRARGTPADIEMREPNEPGHCDTSLP